MKRLWILSLVSLACLGTFCPPTEAWCHGGWSIGINLAPPVFYPPWGCYYYRPYPVYYAPPPVVVQPAPVHVQPAPAPGVQAQPVQRADNSQANPQLTSVSYDNPAEVDRNLPLLADPSEQVRADAALRLGKLKALRAIDPLAATLSGDCSPSVRDAAARALGLIGSTRGLTALKYAAQADSDRDVRHSAQFAVEIIHSNLKR
jgi:hypothetical protein